MPQGIDDFTIVLPELTDMAACELKVYDGLDRLWRMVERYKMTATLTLYRWQTTYDSAVLETDPAGISDCVKAALTAIEERLRSCIEYGGPEHTAIEDARKALATLKATMLGQRAAVRKSHLKHGDIGTAADS